MCAMVRNMNKTMSIAAMRRKFGSDYHVAQVLKISQSAVSRWKAVPAHRVEALLAHPGGKLKRGGPRK